MHCRVYQALGDCLRLAGLECGECLVDPGVDLHLNLSPRVVGH
jgi:hypothetical protein